MIGQGRCWCSSGFGFVGGAKHVEKPLAVLLELRRPTPRICAERVLVRRPAHRHLGQRPIGEHDVRRHLLLLRDACVADHAAARAARRPRRTASALLGVAARARLATEPRVAPWLPIASRAARCAASLDVDAVPRQLSQPPHACAPPGRRNSEARIRGGSPWCTRTAASRRALRDRPGGGDRSLPVDPETPRAASCGVGRACRRRRARCHSRNCRDCSAVEQRHRAAAPPKPGGSPSRSIDSAVVQRRRRRRATSRAAARAPSRRRLAPSSRLMRSGVASSRTSTRAPPSRDDRVGAGLCENSQRGLDVAAARLRLDARRNVVRRRGRRRRSHRRCAAARRTPPRPAPRSGYAPLMKNSCVKRSGNACSRKHSRRLAVAPGASGFLVVRLERSRHRVVHDQAHVRLVDAHAERVRRDDRAHLLRHERVLHVVTLLVVEAGVVRGGRNPRALEHAARSARRLCASTRRRRRVPRASRRRCDERVVLLRDRSASGARGSAGSCDRTR